MQLLECLMGAQAGMRLGELARTLKVPKSSAYQILKALWKTGMVERDDGTQAYRLGYKTLNLGAAYLARLDVVSRALPHMQRLRDESGETVVLSRRVEDRRVDLAVLESPSELKRVAEVGHHVPLHRGAVSQVILAFLPRQEARALLEKAGDDSETVIRALDELEEVVRRGYALSMGERIAGACCIAAPIFDWRGQLCAVLSLSGPLSRFPGDAQSKFVRMVLKAAAAIGRELGGRGGEPGSFGATQLG